MSQRGKSVIRDIFRLLKDNSLFQRLFLRVMPYWLETWRFTGGVPGSNPACLTMILAFCENAGSFLHTIKETVAREFF